MQPCRRGETFETWLDTVEADRWRGGCGAVTTHPTSPTAPTSPLTPPTRSPPLPPCTRPLLLHPPPPPPQQGRPFDQSHRQWKDKCGQCCLHWRGDLMERSGVVHNIITCLVEHAADILNKVAVEPTGEPHMKAPQGKKYHLATKEFGRSVLYKIPAKPRGGFDDGEVGSQNLAWEEGIVRGRWRRLSSAVRLLLDSVSWMEPGGHRQYHPETLESERCWPS